MNPFGFFVNFVACIHVRLNGLGQELSQSFKNDDMISHLFLHLSLFLRHESGVKRIRT